MNIRTCSIFAASLAVFLALGGLRAVPADFSDAAKVLENAIAEHAFPGCTVVVGSDEKLLWSAAFGHLDYSAKERVTQNTIYDLASVTKVAGTTAVFMWLVALGKVNVQEPVSKYLPEFIEAAEEEDERRNRQAITVEHLLTHTAGVISWKPLYRSVHSYRELLDAIFKMPLDAAPGARYRYSDPGMILLGEIAARAGGKPLPDLERELVYKPIEMRDTLRNLPANLRARIAPTEKWPEREEIIRGIVHDENARAGEGITGHAGLFSTAEDLAKLAAELLRGLDGGSELFPQAVVLQFTRKNDLAADASRGLGWGIVSEKSSNGLSPGSFAHTGFTGTSLYVDPARKVFFVLLSNRVHPTRDNNKISRVRRELERAVIEAVELSRTGASNNDTKNE